MAGVTIVAPVYDRSSGRCRVGRVSLLIDEQERRVSLRCCLSIKTEKEQDMKNQDVVRAWRAGKSAATKNLSTDGKSLFSYRLEIGRTEHQDVSQVGGRGWKVVLDYRSPHDFISMTTSQHVALAANYAQEIKTPEGR